MKMYKIDGDLIGSQHNIIRVVLCDIETVVIFCTLGEKREADNSDWESKLMIQL